MSAVSASLITVDKSVVPQHNASGKTPELTGAVFCHLLCSVRETWMRSDPSLLLSVAISRWAIFVPP